MCSEKNIAPYKRIAFKGIGISMLLGGLFWSFSKWQVIKHRVDFWPLQLGAFGGLIFANYLWPKYRDGIQSRLAQHKYILKNKNQTFLEPSFIPFIILLFACVSVSVEMIAFIENFLVDQPLEPILPARTRGWDFLSDYLGGFTIVLYLYLGVALLRWGYVYKRTYSVDAEYALPPRKKQQPLSRKEHLLLFGLILPILSVLAFYFSWKP